MKIDPKTALQRCDTVMLDMDGTILDLAFDNYVWKELVPQRYAASRSMSLEAAQAHLMGLYGAVKGDLEWYCLDHWSERLGLDIVGLHHDVSHRIGYLPGAREFLRELAGTGKRVLLVTNAHQETLGLKDAVTGLCDFVEAAYSSHAYGHAKERQDFWHALQEEVDFDPAKTLFVDDTQRVLRSAEEYGISGLVTVTWPDTSQPRRNGSAYAGVESLAELL